MRVPGRAVGAALLALATGLLVSWVAAAALRASTPEAGTLWRVAPTSKVAIWTLTGAHGSPLSVHAGAEVTDERLRRIGDRIGDLLGRDGGDGVIPSPQADIVVVLAPLTVLLLVGTALAVGMRGSGARTLPEAAAGSAITGGVYGVGLAVLAIGGGARLGFEGRIVTAGVEASVSPVTTLVLGLVWGTFFALIGALAAPAVVDQVPPLLRTVAAGARRAAAVAAVAAVFGLVVLALTRGGDGAGLDPGIDTDLAVTGSAMFGVNLIGTAVVLAHGATMTVNLDAGPLSEWSQLGYVTSSGPSLPVTRWVFLLVPLLAGLAAGNLMRRRSTQTVAAAVGFGTLWGVAMAVLAVLLRVRVLSSFSLGALAAGGGADVQPLIAATLGFVWGAATSLAAMAVGRPAQHTATPAPTPVPPPPPPVPVVASITRKCPNCGGKVPASDRFCGSCGAAI